jgi:hypothetical protein
MLARDFLASLPTDGEFVTTAMGATAVAVLLMLSD